MTDTPRTQAELLSIFADQQDHGITAQDMRDFVVSVPESERGFPSHPAESIWYGTSAIAASLALVVNPSTYEAGDAGGDDYADNAAVFSVRNTAGTLTEAVVVAARVEGDQGTASAFVAEADAAGPSGGAGQGAYGGEFFAYGTNGAHATAIHGLQAVVNATGDGTVVDAAYGLKVRSGKSGANTWTQFYGLFVDTPAVGIAQKTGLHVTDMGSGSVDWNIFSAGATSKNKLEGRVMQGTPNSAPTDADLGNGQVSAYLDQSGNLLKFRVKYSDGTLKTGQVALT